MLVAVADDPRSLEFARPFAWGVLFIGDGAAAESAELGTGEVTAATAHCIAVAVRHAGDLLGDEDATVAVRCRVGARSNDPVTVAHVIDVPSGQISLGDADADVVVDVTPGRWRAEIMVNSAAGSDRVDVWLVPGDDV